MKRKRDFSPGSTDSATSKKTRSHPLCASPEAFDAVLLAYDSADPFAISTPIRKVSITDISPDEPDEATARFLLSEKPYMRRIKDFLKSHKASNRLRVLFSKRRYCVDWLVQHIQERVMKSEPQEIILHLAVNLLTRYLLSQPPKEIMLVNKACIGAATITALVIAIKYEVGETVDLEEVIDRTGLNFTKETIVEMEKTMLNTLDFELTVPNVYTFVSWFLAVKESMMNKKEEEDIEKEEKFKDEENSEEEQEEGQRGDKFYYYVMYLAERTLQEEQFCMFDPSLLASAVLCLGMIVLKEDSKKWVEVMQVCNFRPECEEWLDCMRRLEDVVREDEKVTEEECEKEETCTAVYTKYRSREKKSASMVSLGESELVGDLVSEVLEYLSLG